MSQTLTEMPVRSPAVPPLRDGDRLTRDEFERRWDAMPDLKRAELIEGVVHMPPPPVGFDDHGGPHTILVFPLLLYAAATPGLLTGDNASVRLDLSNLPQPDLFLMVRPTHGGQARIAGGYVEGAPELIAEVSASTARLDLTDKREVYRRNGVREYVVWRTYDFQFDFFLLVNGQYDRHFADADGVYRSRVFPGLWLDVPRLLGGNLADIQRATALGFGTPEHVAFVAKLAAAAGA